MSQAEFDVIKADFLKQLELRQSLLEWGAPPDKRQEQLAKLGGIAVRMSFLKRP